MKTGYWQAEKSGAKTQKEVAVMRSLPVLHVCACVRVCVCMSMKNTSPIYIGLSGVGKKFLQCIDDKCCCTVSSR